MRKTDGEIISVKFFHGIGDTSNFAHQIPLWTRRGYKVEVETTDDKKPLFIAAGATVVPVADEPHPWPHAPAPGTPTQVDHWSGNKAAYNLCHPPMPHIGSWEELWPEYLGVKISLEDQVTTEYAMVDEYLESLPRPIMLLHAMGNTGSESKSIHSEVQTELYRQLLDLGGTVIALDWDFRVPRLNNYRFRHMGDDWHGLNVIELYCLMQRDDILLACDSGPLHFSRFTDIPTLGLWTFHQPSTYLVPRAKTVNIVLSKHNALSKYRRVAYNIVEAPGERLNDAAFIANQARRMLSHRQYVDDVGKDLLLQHLIDRQQGWHSELTSWVDRHITFDYFFKHCPKEGPICETGVIRAEEDFAGAGYSTLLFGIYAQQTGRELISVDLDPTNCQFARAWTAGLPVTVHEKHSHDFLKSYQGPQLAAFYSDSQDVGTPGFMENCLEELKLVQPHLRPDAIIMIDDSPYKSPGHIFQGKGGLGIPWALQNGWRILQAGYQVILGRK